MRALKIMTHKIKQRQLYHYRSASLKVLKCGFTQHNRPNTYRSRYPPSME